MKYSLMTLVLLAGCSAANLTPEQTVARSAAARWQCKPRQVTVEKLGTQTYRAVGCRHEANYACTGGGKRCQVVSGG